MKKRLSMILGAIAFMMTGVASLGCSWWLCDEPECEVGLFND